MVLGAVLILTAGLYHYFTGEQIDQIKKDTVYIQRGVELDGTKYLEGLNTPERVTLIAPDGTVLYDSSEPADKLSNHADRTEVEAALKEGVGESTRHSVTMNENTFNYAVQINNGNVLRVSIQVITFWQVLAGLFQFVGLILVLACVVSYLVAKGLTKYIVSPVDKLDLSHPMETESYPEFAPILRKIDQQNNKISTQMAEANQMRKDFETVTNNMTEGLIILGPQGEVLTVNEAALGLFGVPRPREGAHALSLNRTRVFRHAVESILSGEKSDKRLEKEGQVLELIGSPVYVDKDRTKISGAVLLILDITEKSNLEKMRAQYVSNVTHELKTPLTSIAGFAELLKNGMVSEEDIPKFAGNIYDESRHLIQLVDGVLQISKLDEHKKKSKSWVDVKETADKVVKRLAPFAEKEGVKVAVTASGNLGIIGYPKAVEEILYNLIDNAIKYNEKGGTVRVALDGKGKSDIRFTVSDTGEGVRPEDRERIFERFYRSDVSRSKKTGGSGLGLSIVKHGVQSMEGEIKLDSVPGKGTSIRITLPRK